MLLPIKIICNARKSRRDGTSLIFIQYCCSSQHRVLLNSQIAIPASYFTPKKQCISEELPEEYGDVDLLNKELKRMLRTIEDLIEHAAKAGIENIGTYVKDVFTPEMDIADISLSEITESTYTSRKKAPDLFMEIDNYIISKEKRVSKKALCTFHSMKAHLLAYEQFRKTPITFDSFDYNFYEGFIDFLTYDYKLPRKSEPTFGLKTNTVGKTIKQLRIFIRDRVKRKIIQPIDLSDYKIPEEET
ncbi:MAG: phage integrase SAM-like domain-containing protein, partial [Chitinophagales bacterium]|nr:phage integrase SAM-like domain-containing protein [Chitinophagales bacterium]